jgi:hypothetical protein
LLVRRYNTGGFLPRDSGLLDDGQRVVSWVVHGREKHY